MAARELSSEASALELPRSPAAELNPEVWAARLKPAIPWAVCVGLTLAVYGSSLRAGIMFDAALDLPRASDRSWLEVLTNAGPSPYYRPITLLLWKACFELLGRNDFTVLHGLSLASHTICGWLVCQLGRRLMGFWPGLTAAALFVLFPLSYQVVGFVDSLFHSLAAVFVLAAAVLYWDARTRGRRWRLAAAMAAGALALLTHESMVALLTPAILALEVVRGSKCKVQSAKLPTLSGDSSLDAQNDKPTWLWPGLFAIETVVFIGVWLLVPRWPSRLHLDVPSIRLNAAYFIQALGYPLTMQLGSWPRLGNDVLEVLSAAGVATAVLFTLGAKRKRLVVSCFGLAWSGFALLPAWLFLPWPNYVIDAPRLLYSASAGIALLWAAALAPNWESGRRVARDISGSAVLLAVVGVSWSFLATRERLLDRGAGIVSQLIETAAKAGTDAGRIYVNVPAFVGPKGTDFLLGHAGVTMLPDYFGLDLEVAGVTGTQLPISSLADDELAQAWDVAYGLQGQRVSPTQASTTVNGGGGVYVSRFAPNQYQLDYVGRVDKPAPAATAPVARFGNWAALEGAMAQLRNGVLLVDLHWRALAPAPGDYTVFVHVAGDQPQPLIQSDGYAIGGLLPPRSWQAGSVINDVRSISVPGSARNEHLRVLVGLYDRAAPTTRATATSASGSRWTDDAVEIAVSGAGAP